MDFLRWVLTPITGPGRRPNPALATTKKAANSYAAFFMHIMSQALLVRKDCIKKKTIRSMDFFRWVLTPITGPGRRPNPALYYCVLSDTFFQSKMPFKMGLGADQQASMHTTYVNF